MSIISYEVRGHVACFVSKKNMNEFRDMCLLNYLVLSIKYFLKIKIRALVPLKTMMNKIFVLSTPKPMSIRKEFEIFFDFYVSSLHEGTFLNTKHRRHDLM